MKWFFVSTMIWNHTDKGTQHTQGPVDWHTHTNTHYHHLLCSHSSYLYYIEWIIRWYQKITLQSSPMSLLFKTYWLVEVTYLLVWFNETKFFPENAKNTDGYGVNKQNTQTHHLLRER